MSKTMLYMKMFAAGTVLCVGGPALIYYVSPTEEELFKRYNPQLQKRSLENRQGRQEEINRYVDNLKELSRSNNTIWQAAAVNEIKTGTGAADAQRNSETEIRKRKEEVQRHSRVG